MPEKPTYEQLQQQVKALENQAIDMKKEKEEREELIEKLQVALTQTGTLSGVLPICSSCKRIRDDKGYWNDLESYITKHSQAEFTHGICTYCAEKLYPEYSKPRLLYSNGRSFTYDRRTQEEEIFVEKRRGIDRRNFVERRNGVERRRTIERRAVLG